MTNVSAVLNGTQDLVIEDRSVPTPVPAMCWWTPDPPPHLVLHRTGCF